MAIEKTVILNVETKEATKNIDLLSRSFEDAYGEIQPLSGRMGELEDQLYELANAGKQGTDEFKILSQEVGRMRRVMQQTDLATDSLAKTTSQKLGGSLNFVAGGFSTFQGAMGAVGVDSAKLEETMLKVQSAMAITQGIDSMREGYKDIKALSGDLAKSLAKSAVGQKLLSAAQVAGAATMKALNFIMKQNPILLIVSAVAALVAAFALLGNAEEDEAAKQERLIAKRKKAEDQLRSEIDLIKQKQRVSKGNVSQLENELKILQSKGATDEQIYKKEKEINQKRIAELAYIKGYRGKLSNEEALEYNNLLTQKYVLTNEYNKKNREQAEAASKESGNKRKENYSKQKEEQKKQAEELKELQKKAEQDLLDEINKIAEIRLEAQKKGAEDRKAQAAKDEQDIYDNQIGFLEAQITADEENIAAKKDLLDIQKDLELQNKELTEGEIAAIEAKYRKQKEDLDKQAADKELQAKKTLQDAIYQTIYNGLNTIGSIAELFAGKSRASQKKAFQVQKAVNIATATVDTFKAATSAFSSMSGIPIVGPALGGVAAAAAIAAGLVNIKKISSTQFEGGGSGGGAAGSVPSVPNVPNVQAANFNVVGAGGANQLAQLSSNPIKAYVVSNDVTSAQSLDRNIVKNATI
jgi:hypothetical protein